MTWKHLELLESVHYSLISSDLVSYKKVGSTIVFASQGASYLGDHIKMIKRTFDRLPFTNHDDNILIDYHKDRRGIRVCNEDRKCSTNNHKF